MQAIDSIVACSGATGQSMAITLKQRVEELERQVAELSKALDAKATTDKPRDKDWRRTIGMSANDAGFEEMVRLGREYRQRQRPRGKPNAGS